MFKKIFIEIMKVYQKTLSPDHGCFSNFYPANFKCRFYPSCSQYLIFSLEKKGFIKGLIIGLKRILRCNPFNDGGYDPI